MNKKHLLLLLFTAVALGSLLAFSGCKKDKEPEAPKLPAHIQARVVKDLYFPETKALETKKDDIFLAAKTLGWENGSFPAFEDLNQEKSWTFARKKEQTPNKLPFDYAVYAYKSLMDGMPKACIFVKSCKPEEYNDALIAEKGGLLEQYGFTDRYFKDEKPEGASKWRVGAKNSQLNLGAIIMVLRGESHIVDGKETDETAFRIMMFVGDWEELEAIFS